MDGGPAVFHTLRLAPGRAGDSRRYHCGISAPFLDTPLFANLSGSVGGITGSAVACALDTGAHRRGQLQHATPAVFTLVEPATFHGRSAKPCLVDATGRISLLSVTALIGLVCGFHQLASITTGQLIDHAGLAFFDFFHGRGGQLPRDTAGA